MPHRLARRRRETRDVGDNRLRQLGLDERRCLLLLVAADLADHDDVLGLGVGLELREDVDERRADDRVATDADDRRVAEPPLRQLVADLVGQRAGARDEADVADVKISAGMIPTLALPGESAPGQFGPISVTPRSCT